MRRRFTILFALSMMVGLAAANRLALAQEHEQPADHSADADAHSPGAEAGEQKGILSFDPNLALYTLVTFAILLFILGKYAWKPLIKAMEDREHGFQKVFDEAERARAEAAALLDKNRELLAHAHEDIRALIDEARRDAQSTADEIMKKAQAEADATRQRTQREIGMAKDEALMEIWSKSADLAVSVAQKVLVKEIGPDEHRRLIDLATQQIQAESAPNGRERA